MLQLLFAAGAKAVLAVLAAAVAYEGAVAAGALDIGREPGQGSVGGGLVLAAAVLALVVGAGLGAVLAGVHAGEPAEPAEWLLAPAAAAFVAVRFYAFDPYYAPSLRRFSEGGLVAPAWIYALSGLAVVAALLTRARPRPGLAATAVILLLSAVTAVAESGGH